MAFVKMKPPAGVTVGLGADGKQYYLDSRGFVNVDSGSVTKLTNEGWSSVTDMAPGAVLETVKAITDPVNGGITLIGPDGQPIDVGGSYAEASNTAVYAYNEDGSVTKRKMPKRSRILSSGSVWFQPTSLSATGARSVDVYSGGAFIAQNATDTLKPVVMTCLTAGYIESTWTSLNLTVPADGLLQALIYVDDYQNGAASPLSGTIDIKLTNAGGNNTYKFSSTAFKPGWNTLQLWNPAADANHVCNKSGVSYLSASAFNYSAVCTQISLVVNSAALNSRVIFAGIFTQTKVKPMVCMTFDTSALDVFSNFVPAWKARGLTAGLRAGGTSFYRTTPEYIAGLKSAMADGFDVYNGSWTRLNLNTATTAADFAKEVGLQQNWMSRYGFQRGANLFSSAGNASPKASIYRDVFPKFGVSVAKGGGGQGSATFCGPAGFDDPLCLTVKGWGGMTAAQNQVQGLLQTGGILMWFAHDCPVYDWVSPRDGPSVTNGGGMWAEDAPLIADYLKTLVDAGSIDVVSPSQLAEILDGTL